MTGEIITTVVGNLADDPELRFTPSGVAVAQLRVASTPRTLDRNRNEWVDGAPTWVRIVAWRNLGQNAAESLHRGDRVICYGPLENREYEDKEGNKRTSLEMNAWSIGPDLAWVSADIKKGVHDGAKERKRDRKPDPLDGTSTERPTGNAGAVGATADTQRSNPGEPPEFARSSSGAAGGAGGTSAFDDL